MKLILCVFALPLAAQIAVVPPGTTGARITVTIKQQTRKLCIVTVANESPYSTTISRASILARAPTIPQLTKEQATGRVSNSPWAIAARVGGQVRDMAPAGLSAAGIATKSPSLGWWGLGVTFVAYLVSRATARAAQPIGSEMPDKIPLPANDGGEWLLHTAKLPKNMAPVSFQFQVDHEPLR